MIVKVYDEVWRVTKSNRINKQMKATRLKDNYVVHFGDPNMREFPGTKRGNNYCSRSFGIGNLKNTQSANFWSRWYLWNCKGKKSYKKRPKFLSRP